MDYDLEEDVDIFTACSYDADLIIMSPSLQTRLWRYEQAVLLPDPKDFVGKIVEVICLAEGIGSRVVNNQTKYGQILIGCVVDGKMKLGTYWSGGWSFASGTYDTLTMATAYYQKRYKLSGSSYVEDSYQFTVSRMRLYAVKTGNQYYWAQIE